MNPSPVPSASRGFSKKSVQQNLPLEPLEYPTHHTPPALRYVLCEPCDRAARAMDGEQQLYSWRYDPREFAAAAEPARDPRRRNARAEMDVDA